MADLGLECAHVKWSLKHGDLLDEPADVLVCSANVFLNLSGGVGGAFLLRYGGQMQEELHRYLAQRQIRSWACTGSTAFLRPRPAGCSSPLVFCCEYGPRFCSMSGA